MAATANNSLLRLCTGEFEGGLHYTIKCCFVDRKSKPLDIFIKIKNNEQKSCTILLEDVKWDRSVADCSRNEVSELIAQGKLKVSISPCSSKLFESCLFVNEIGEKTLTTESSKTDNKWKTFAHRDEGAVSVQKDGAVRIATVSGPHGKDKSGFYLFGCLAYTRVIKIDPETTYTLSGEIKTSNLSGAAAFFNVEYLQENANGDLVPAKDRWIDNRYAQLSGNHEWSFRQLTFTTAPEATHIRIYLEVDHHSLKSSGEAFFRDIRLSESELALPWHEQNELEVAKRYDDAGNLTQSSKRFKMAPNLLVGSNFNCIDAKNRLPVGWEPFHAHDKGAVVSDKVVKRGQTHSIKVETLSTSENPKNIGETHTLGCSAAIQVVEVQPDTTYTLSGYIKTEQLTNARAFFNVEFLQEYNDGSLRPCATRWIDCRYSALRGTNDWVRRQVTFKTGSDTSHVRIYLEVDHRHASTKGCAWFDQIQLEEGSVPTAYNMVENSSFIKGLSSWSLSEGDGKIDPECQALRFRRTAVEAPRQQYKQVIPMYIPKGESITVTGLSKANEVQNLKNNGPNEDYAIWIDAMDAKGRHHARQVPFTLGTHDWERAAGTFTFDEDIKHINLYVLFRGNNTGTVWFDAIRVECGKAMTSYHYSDKQLKEIVDFRGNRHQFSHKGNAVICVNPRGHAWHYENEEAGDKASEQVLKSVRAPGKRGGEVKYHYCPTTNNLLSREIGAFGENKSITTYSYDEDGSRLLKVINALGMVTEYFYDDEERKIAILSADGSIVSYSFDEQERVTGEWHNDTERYHYVYTENGLEVFDTLLKIRRIYTYSDHDWQRVELQDGKEIGTVSWKFDKDKKITETLINHAGEHYKIAYGYNELGQNTIVTDPYGNNYHLDYNDDNFLTLLSTKNGNSASYTMDQGRIEQLVLTKKGQPLVSWRYKYDANGNRVELEERRLRKNTIVHTTLKNDYDECDQLITEEVYFPKSKKKGFFEYQYDSRGNRLSRKGIDADGKSFIETCSYNLANQLEHKKSCDENGHLLAVDEYTYDQKGNLCKAISKDGKDHIIAVKNFYWDIDGSLLSVTEGSGDAETVIAEYSYDEQGRRTRADVRGIVTNFCYDGDKINVLYESDEDGNITALYNWSADGRLLSVIKEDQTYYYHNNEHGDVIAVTDEKGEVVASYSYDAWGNILESEGSFAEENPYRYAGYRYDSATGLYYLFNRYYNPVNGNFLSIDPFAGSMENITSQNGYCYAANNPVMHVDHDGAIWKKIWEKGRDFVPFISVYDLAVKLKNGTAKPIDGVYAFLDVTPMGKVAKIAGKFISLAAKGAKNGGKKSKIFVTNITKGANKNKKISKPPQPKNQTKMPSNVKRQSPSKLNGKKGTVSGKKGAKNRGTSAKKSQNKQPTVYKDPKKVSTPKPNAKKASKPHATGKGQKHPTPSKPAPKASTPKASTPKGSGSVKGKDPVPKKVGEKPVKSHSALEKKGIVANRTKLDLPVINMSYFQQKILENACSKLLWRPVFAQFSRKSVKNLVNIALPFSGAIIDLAFNPTNSCDEGDLNSKDIREPVGFKIGYINGINNSRDECISTATWLSKRCDNVKVHWIYNPTHRLADVPTCGLLLAGLELEPERRLLQEWEAFAKTHSNNPSARYYQFCHSGGAIYVHNALKNASPEVRKKIVVIGIAPAKISNKENSGCAEAFNYGSDNDIVHRLDFAIQAAVDLRVLATPLPVKVFVNQAVVEAKLKESGITVLPSKVQRELFNPAKWLDHKLESPTFEGKIIERMEKIRKTHNF